MAKMVWDQAGDRLYETGVKECALFVMSSGEYGAGVPWNGLTKISESPSGAEASALWANDAKYGELISNEEFGGTIEAYTYPDEFEACDGSAALSTGVYITQQPRSTFGLVYKTTVGSDDEGLEYGYKLHIVYGAKAKPSAKERSTINDSPEAITMSWEFTTTPVAVTDHKPTAHLVIDSNKVGSTKMALIEGKLYGTADTTSQFQTPDEILELISD